jgi:hypothetical protein
MIFKAISAIKNSWVNQGESVIKLPINIELWHSGNIDFKNPNLDLRKVTWFTKDKERQDYYNGFALINVKENNVKAYKTKLKLVREINLAEFYEYPFLDITSKYLTGHGELNIALNKFCEQNNLDGVICGESLNEVVIRACKIIDCLELLEQIDLIKENSK